MNSIFRNNDLITGNEDLILIQSLPKFPVFLGCVDHDSAQDKFFDMNFYISRSSGMIQLNPMLPLDVVYKDDHSQGSVGSAWSQHHIKFAEFIHRHSPRSVFEIGGAHGMLCRAYSQIATVDWTIIEPNPVASADTPAKIIKGWFTDATSVPSGIDMIVHSHVLEHMYDPTDFFRNLSTLAPGVKTCFSVPNIKLHIEKKYTNAIQFEHTYSCIKEYIEYWLQRFGFNLIDQEYYGEHSVFYSAIRTDRAEQDTPVPDLYHDNKKLMTDFFEYHRSRAITLNAELQKQSAYLFGAHVFSQYQLAFGLDASKIICLLDNSPQKQNRRLYGTDLFVSSPKVLKDQINPVVILHAGQYSEEIKKDIIDNINPTTIFLE